MQYGRWLSIRRVGPSFERDEQHMKQPSLNGPCACGSGKKYKRCCGASLLRNAPDTREFRKPMGMGFPSGQPSARNRVDAHAGDPKVLWSRAMGAFTQKNYHEARTWLETAIHENHRDPRLHDLMGQVMAAQGEAVEAERAFSTAVTLDPDFSEGWYNLGLSLKTSNQLVGAVDAFQQALRRLGDDAELNLHLAETHYMMRDLDMAENAVRRVLAIGGNAARGNMWLSLVLRAKDACEESLQAEAAALGKSEWRAEAFALLLKFGRIDVLLGNLKQAEYWFGRAMMLVPDSPEPYIQLSVSKKFAGEDYDLVEKMDSLAHVPRPRPERLHFALGKVYDDLGEYRRSFEHYRTANNIVLESVKFEPSELAADVTRLIGSFSMERIARLPGGSDSDLPVFIVGTPRSGTTLVEQIVSSHSKVAGAGELAFWGKRGGPVMDAMSNYNQAVASGLASDYLELLRGYSREASRIVDKMPGNFSLLGLIHAVFPNARVIHCRRHPIDACLSMYFQNFNKGHRYKFSLEGLAAFYEQYVRLMAHWRAVLRPGTIYEVRYEDLIEDPAGVSRKTMEFLGLDWEEAQMDFFSKERPVFTCSKWQVRQPIYRSSKDRWKRYTEYIGPLLPLLKYA